MGMMLDENRIILNISSIPKEQFRCYSMEIITSSISREELSSMAGHFFGYMVKAVVDLRRGIMGIDAELHADIERYLMEDGSQQANLWGINPYPDEKGEEFIEFDSIINIRPHQDNPSRDVLDSGIREQISALVNKLVK